MSSASPIGSPFIELHSVDSTNNYAMGLARAAMAHHGTAVFAHEQTRGKGQRTKQWESQKDQNIAISLIIEPETLIGRPVFLLSMAAACAVQAFFHKLTGEDFKIKWPNDIYWRDRKAAGILIENLWQGNQWKFAVLGIGININQTDFGSLGSKAVSLKQITGKDWEPAALAKELCLHLENKWQLLLHQPQAIETAYRSHLYKLNEMVRFKKENRIFEARVMDVSTEGQLVLFQAIEERFDVGEVEWLANEPS